MRRRPPRSTLFPSATPFRSAEQDRDPDGRDDDHPARQRAPPRKRGAPPQQARKLHPALTSAMKAIRGLAGDEPALRPSRSEEHTSELQSRQYLVCRLLLETK